MHDERFSKAQTAVLARYGMAAAEERWVEAPSVEGRAHVLVYGTGPPVVALNGGGVPAAMLAPLLGRVDGVTWHAIDLPGFGLTDVAPRFTDDLRANGVAFLSQVLDGLGLERPVVVGSSLGALISSWLAIDRPDRVAALAHVGCPAIVLDTSAPLPMRLLSARPLGRLMMKLQPPSERQVRQLAEMVHEHPLPTEMVELILATERVDHFEEAFLATLRRLLRLRGSRPDLALTADQLRQIDLPALLVFATDDPMGGPEVGRRMAGAMDRAEVHVVPGGHAPWIHHTDEIAPILTRFLTQVAPRMGRGPSR